MKQGLMAMSILACMGLAACSKSSSDRMLGTWQADAHMAMTVYPTQSTADPGVVKPRGAGVPFQMPWQVTIARDAFDIVAGPADEVVGGRKVHAPAFHFHRRYSLVSVHGDDIVIAIDGDKSLQPTLNTLHFDGPDAFWMINSGGGESLAKAARMHFRRIR